MMQDIGKALNTIMQNKQCSSIYAFLLLSKDREEGDADGICKLQFEPTKKTGRRLRYKSDI